MSYNAYVSTTRSAQPSFSTQSSFWATSFPTSARRHPASRICWATVRDGLALAAMFGSFYCWLWLGWAMAPS